MPNINPLVIRFDAPLAVNDTIVLSWIGTGGTVVTATETFKTLRSTFYETTIGTDGPSQAQYYYTALSTDYGVNFILLIDDNVVYVWSRNTENPVTGVSTSDSVVFNPDIYEDIVDIKSRSPYLLIKPGAAGDCTVYTLGTTGATASFVYRDCLTGDIVGELVPPYTIVESSCAVTGSAIGPTGTTITAIETCDGLFNFDTTTYDIRIWKGDLFDVPVEISYAKTKQKVINSQSDIYINLSNLVREDLEGDISTYLANIPGDPANDIGPTESKWVNVETGFSYLGEKITQLFDNNFFVLDGYISPRESQDINKNVLISGTSRVYNENSKACIHFKTYGLESIEVHDASTSTTIDFTDNPFTSTSYVQAIGIDTTQNKRYGFNYSDSSVSVYVLTYVNLNDCKHEAWDVIFKNKWGVLETIGFNKKSSRSLSIENSDYLRSIVDYNGSFNPDRHTNKVYNTTGYEEWTLNTDWLPEYMNQPLEELMLSEEIWLFNGNYPVPINKADTSISYKTNVNDGLIQYTLKFKLSHNSINNIL